MRIILLLVLLLGAVGPAVAAVPSWEVVQANTAQEQGEAEKIEVSVKDGCIYIATAKPVTVKVYSIVGQLISEKSLPAGVSRLRIGAHGIYILKAGANTVRVNI